MKLKLVFDKITKLQKLNSSRDLTTELITILLRGM